MKNSNPYKPGMAVTPPALVGRDQWLADFRISIEMARRREPPKAAMVLLGVRGVGKTVLLEQFILAARAADFAALRLVVDPDPDRSLAVQLAEDMPRLIDQLHDKSRKVRARRGELTGAKPFIKAGPLSGEVSAAPVVNHPANLAAVVRHLNEHALHTDRSVAIMVDELQDATLSDLRAFARVIDLTAAENMPIVLVGAGLPALQMRAPKVGPTSFTERADWSEVPFLTPAQTREAIDAPAQSNGARFEPAALDTLVTETRGYPYLIQVLGSHAWECSGDQTVITLDHARTAIAKAQAQLDKGLYGLRWNKCTPRERTVLTAMAVLERDTGSPIVQLADIARLLMVPANKLSTQRDSLIRKELVEPVNRGQLQFTLPGMAESIIRTTSISTAQQLAKPTARVDKPLPKQLRP